MTLTSIKSKHEEFLTTIQRVVLREVRDSLTNDIDPALAKKETARQQKIAKSKAKTFGTCVTEYIELQRPIWNNAKHAQQWANTLNTYSSLVVGKMPIGHIDTDDVLKILKPTWTTKPETASRLSGRIDSALSWATMHG